MTERTARLRRIGRHDFGVGTPFTEDEKVYFRDLLASHGLPCPEERFAGGRTTFTEMVEWVIDWLGPVDDPFDIALLAHTTPDAQPGSPMSFLTTAVPVSGVAFAVSDQGVVAPFTALDLLSRHERGLLVIADQRALVHDLPVPEVVAPRRDSAVVLEFGGSAGLATVAPCLRTDVRPVDIGPVLADVDPDATVVVGAGVARHWQPDGAVTIHNGAPCTGLWAALADLVAGSATGRVVLVDYEETLGCLGTCVVTVGSTNS